MVKSHDELQEPRTPRQEFLRELAEAAMSVTHHDAAEHEIGYIHEVNIMEGKFSRLLRSYEAKKTARAAEEERGAARAEVERLKAALGQLLVAARLLYANAEGCAVNHYAEDFATHGLPGWLTDCRAGIEAARAATKEEPQP